MSRFNEYIESARMQVLQTEKLCKDIISKQELKKVDDNWTLKQKIDKEIKTLGLGTDQVNNIYSKIADMLGLVIVGFFVPKDKSDESSKMLDENKIWHTHETEGNKTYFEVFSNKESIKAQKLIEKKFNGIFD